MDECRRAVALEDLTKLVDEARAKFESAVTVAKAATAQLKDAEALKAQTRGQALAAIGLAQQLYTTAEVEPLVKLMRLFSAEATDPGHP